MNRRLTFTTMLSGSNIMCGSTPTSGGSASDTFSSPDSDSNSTGSSNYQWNHGNGNKRKKKAPVHQVKNLRTDVTSFVYLQDTACADVQPKVSKCRECARSAKADQYSCRFFRFRKLRCINQKETTVEGFLHPYKDPVEEDLKVWKALRSAAPADLDVHVARFLLMQVGDQFCNLMHQEKEAHDVHVGKDKNVVWKRPMRGVRELCDCCKTTLFNMHWFCSRCGFVACIDCYKEKRQPKRPIVVKGDDRDDANWLFCNNHRKHNLDKMTLCQIIGGKCLEEVGQLLHNMRHTFRIPQTCKCSLSEQSKDIAYLNPDKLQEILAVDPLEAIVNFLENQSDDNKRLLPVTSSTDDLVGNGLFDEVDSSSGSDTEEEVCDDSALRAAIFQTKTDSPPGNSLDSNSNSHNSLERSPSATSHVSGRISPSQASGRSTPSAKRGNKSQINELYGFISNVLVESEPDSKIKSDPIDASAIRIMTLAESKIKYPNVDHGWLCGGRLLRLMDPGNPENYRIFQDQWRRGQPVIVSNMSSRLDISLWHPKSFCRDFGNQKNDLINCLNGNLVPNQPMSKFWEGFESCSKRLQDEDGNPMLLKLKDWPPGEDFAEMLPKRFKDLMQALPLAEYTHRSGRLNLASRLPDFFVRPDLGPKMYNAYGCAVFPSKGTTNLHLDISDAVNFMVYVGIPEDSVYQQNIDEAYRAIDNAGCDPLTRQRIRNKDEMPGALWHIYHARDSDKIRDLLNKVAIERSIKLEPHHDPIHDQSWYLDEELRRRLYREYNVEGYAIVQCLGDAVFIPAGAPHQVRNLHNCIKVAEDFVSPENVSHCFSLTQEFRDLSETHSNHEDKLQIKNIIYHTIKDALSSLLNNMTDGDVVSSALAIDERHIKTEPIN